MTNQELLNTHAAKLYTYNSASDVKSAAAKLTKSIIKADKSYPVEFTDGEFKISGELYGKVTITPELRNLVVTK